MMLNSCVKTAFTGVPSLAPKPTSFCAQQQPWLAPACAHLCVHVYRLNESKCWAKQQSPGSAGAKVKTLVHGAVALKGHSWELTSGARGGRSDVKYGNIASRQDI